MAKTLNDLEIGSIVNLKENGELVPFIVLQHQYYIGETARPINCTTILRKYCMPTKQKWDASRFQCNYTQSNICAYLNNDYYNTIEEDVKAKIINTNIETTTNSPGGYSTGRAKILLLSQREYKIGGTADGKPIDYFDTADKKKGQLTDGGEYVNHWTRTGEYNSSHESGRLNYAKYINPNGNANQGEQPSEQYFRPAMNFPNDMTVTEDEIPLIFVNNPPTAPGNLTVGAIAKGYPVDISWTASTDPDGAVASYTLQRQVDGAPFETINSGNVLTYQDTVGNEWGTVAYRVAAVDDLGASSDWATSQTYTVQDGLLYIEGPADELGTQNKAFTFTFAVKATGASQPASVAIVAQVDGATVFNEPAANVRQQYSFTVDARPMQAGAHTISVAATADNFVSYRDTYNFDVDAFSFPAGGLKVINQDYLGRPHFYPTMANMVLMPDGKNLAEKIEELMGGAG